MKQIIYLGGKARWGYPANPTRTIIVPIPKKQEGEEELWKAAEAEFIEQADIANYDISVITDTPYFRWLKRNFTITRKS